jgi:hypothetical protein
MSVSKLFGHIRNTGRDTEQRFRHIRNNAGRAGTAAGTIKEREEKKVGMERAVEGDISRMETHTHTHTHPPTHMEGMGDAGGGAGHCIVEETVGMQLEQATSWSKAHGKQCEWWTATTVPPRPHDTFATAMRPPP